MLPHLISFLFVFTSIAEAGPTVEELALRANLENRTTEAMKTLEKDDSPHLRWIAGRLALQADNTTAARRLLDGEDLGSAWGRIALELLRDPDHAAELALEQMDEALQGTHRDAMATMLVDWAIERAPKDPNNAARFLGAAIGLEPSLDIQHRAQDSLFRLPAHAVGAVGDRAARQRIVEEPANIPARLRAAVVLSGSRPTTSAEWLLTVIRLGEEDDAVAAATALTAMILPDSIALEGLAAVAERFVESVEVRELRLEHAVSLASRDEQAGISALAALTGLPDIGVRALQAQARATSDAMTRRETWLALATREGASALGDVARREALSALLEAAEALPPGEGRRTFAVDALGTDDGAGQARLLYLALPDGSARTEALWAHAARFPAGPWCAELADILVEEGADTDTAERYVGTCTSHYSGRGAILQGQASEAVTLVLEPTIGGLDVAVSTAKELDVSQHRVDAEALFRGTVGHPLDTALDASLLEADLSWTTELEADHAQIAPLSPRRKGNLFTLTVRAGDHRATALVVPDPFDVQIVRRGADVSIAVLREGSPVTGAELLVQDAQGTVHKGRTDGRGIALLHDRPSTLRVMAQKGTGLGFAVSDQAGAVAYVAPSWSLVPWDRATSMDGEMADVQVFGTFPVGGITGTRLLKSFAIDGQELDQADVVLENGVAQAKIFAQGGGSLALYEEDETALSQVILQTPGTGVRDLRISFSEVRPDVGGRVEAHVTPLGAVPPEGFEADVTLTTPWSSVKHRVSLPSEGKTFEIDLTPAAPGDQIATSVQIVGGHSVGAAIHVAYPSTAAAPTLPALVEVGASLDINVPDGSWILATSEVGGQRWARSNSLSLPTAGMWQICVWSDRCGPQALVLVVDGSSVDARGIWQGEPTLVALTAEGIRDARIVRPGETLDKGSIGLVTGTRTAWLSTATDERPLPVRGAEQPQIAVSGKLRRGSASVQVGADLPEGSRIWAFLRDASDMLGPALAPSVSSLWQGQPGWSGEVWEATELWGQEIAQALLQEEERLSEISNMERVDFGFDAAAESGILGLRGSGAGGGGTGEGFGGIGSRGSGHGRSGYGGGARLAGDPEALGVILDVPPGELGFEIPAWVDAADLAVVARTPDGRWGSYQVRLPVQGETLVALPPRLGPELPDTWTGDNKDLLPVARSLSGGSRMHALAALDASGLYDARAPMLAAQARGGFLDPSAVIARSMRGLPPASAQSASRSLESLADVRLAERADAALGVATAEPDRAKAVATRLLGEPDLPPYVRARAGLTLWLAGDKDGALQALAGSDPWIAAARAAVIGKADPEHASIWWTAAVSEGAHPTERALAVHALSLTPGKAVNAADSPAGNERLIVDIQPPLATWRGQRFTRQFYVAPGEEVPELPAPTEVSVGRDLPLLVLVPPHPEPTRLACTGTGRSRWIPIGPASHERQITCHLAPAVVGPLPIEVRWVAADGRTLGVTTADLKTVAVRDSAPDDPMSSREQLELGTRLAATGEASGLDLLESLLATAPLPAAQTAQAATAVLDGQRQSGDAPALIAAFQAYRERVPHGVLDLETASAVAHAYGEAGQPERAVAASQVVLDARFKEELSAVRTLQEGGLELTALKLLREVLGRYPEVPTVISARFLAPSMLLQRAEGDGDRLGYTRSSLRHTAAAELASFLLLHPDSRHAPEAAAMLTDALRTLGDPARERALAGLLARKYRDGEVAWRLSLADARAHLAEGDPKAAVRILDRLTTPPQGVVEVELERGRAFDLLGKTKEASEAYGRSGGPEAMDRAAWLKREDIALPSLLVLVPGMPSVVQAHLRPGAEVTVTAVRVNLEAVMLRDNGQLNADAINVQGLRPAASRTFSVGKDGDVPLPSLASGAYLMTVVTGTSTGRFVLVRTDAELVVNSPTGYGSFVHLFDRSGNALVDAQLWLFSGGQVETARTDGAGSAWLDIYAPGVLARTGDRYALHVPDPNSYAPPRAPRPSPGRSSAYGGLLEKNAMEYDALFQQDAYQRVEASGL